MTSGPVLTPLPSLFSLLSRVLTHIRCLTTSYTSDEIKTDVQQQFLKYDSGESEFKNKTMATLMD